MISNWVCPSFGMRVYSDLRKYYLSPLQAETREVQSPQMPSADLVALAILPAVIWVSLAYVASSTSEVASRLRAAWHAKTKRELFEGAQSWALYSLIIFSVVLVIVLVWARLQASNALEVTLNPSGLERQTFHGIILGLALVGMVLILRHHFPEAKKFGFLVMAGIASPPSVRALALVLVAFTEELWRVVCLKTLVADGFSGPQAVVATSVAYGLAYLAWGYPVAFSDGIIGAVYGALFLWSGSFFVPFGAHITLRGHHLLYAIAAAPDAGPGDIHRKPHTKCPACGTMLSMRQVNLNINEAFLCPSCHSRVTISDLRRNFLRWGSVFVGIVLMVAFWDVIPGAVRGSYALLWLSLALTFCAGIGLFSILQVIFPPRLECGGPDFVGLDLSDGSAPRPDGKNSSEHGEHDSK